MKSYAVSPEVRSIVTPTGITLVDVISGEILQADWLGCLVWLGLAEHRSIEDIVQGIASLHSLPADSIKHDVEEFIRKLAESSLVSGETQESVPLH
jgi:hypothetical protein